MGGHEGEPEQVVGDAGAHPGAAGRVPPVLHVALFELARGGAQDLGAGEIGARVEERAHVLQLIAEAERAAGLIKGGAPPQTAGEILVEQPAVEQEVDGLVRRLDLNGVEKAVPPRARGGERLLGAGAVAETLDNRARLGGVFGLPQ